MNQPKIICNLWSSPPFCKFICNALMGKPVWRNPDDARFWYSLIGLGLVLRVLGSFVSTISVDTHLHSTYVVHFLQQGSFELTWGPNRNPLYPLASDPSSAGSDIGWRYAVWHSWLMMWIAAFGRSYAVLHVSGLVLSAIMLVTVYLVSRHHFGSTFALRVSTFASIQPALIAGASMAMMEDLMVIYVTLACHFLLKGLDQIQARRWPLWWIGGVPVVWAFGFTKGTGWDMLMIVAASACVWLLLSHHLHRFRSWLIHHPVMGLTSFAATIWSAMLLRAYLSPSLGWSLSESLNMPVRFAYSFGLSLVVFVGLWGFIGLFAWPYVRTLKQRLEKGPLTMRELHLWMLVVLTLSFITLTNASFWCYEGSILGWSVHKTAAIYIHNGRYLSVMLIPLHWCIAISEQSLNSAQKPSEQAPRQPQPIRTTSILGQARPQLMLAVLLIVLPSSSLMAVAMAFHPDGEAEDVSIELGDEIEDGESFLLVTRTYASMSRLYLYSLGVDAEGDRNITGHWRSMETPWETELQGDYHHPLSGSLENVTLVVVAKEVNVSHLDGWVPIDSVSLPDGWLMVRSVDWIQASEATVVSSRT